MTFCKKVVIGVTRACMHALIKYEHKYAWVTLTTENDVCVPMYSMQLWLTTITCFVIIVRMVFKY